MTLGITPHSLSKESGSLLDDRTRHRLRALPSMTSSKIQLLATPPGVAGFVLPGKSRAIHLNLYTALFAPMDTVSRVVEHEQIHLKHEEVMDMEIPFFEQMQDCHMDLMVELFGDDHPFSDLNELIEGFTEGATIQKVGSTDDNCPYTFREVPKMELLEALVQSKSNKSLLQPFVRMDSSSRGDFLSAMRDTINTLMLERVLFGSIHTDRSLEDTPDLKACVQWYHESFPDKTIESHKEAEQLMEQYRFWHSLN